MYRMVDCATWDDPWFESLHPKGKLFFLYLLTNPRSTSCGAFEITPRKMAFETGLTVEDVEGFLKAWAPKVQWFPEHSIVFLKNFYRRQVHLPRFARDARRRVAALPEQVQSHVLSEYPELAAQPGDDIRPRMSGERWREVRQRIFLRDDYTCQYCGARGGKLECDHVMPFSLGGSHEDENLVTSCKSCNRSKRAKRLEEWVR